MSFTDMLILNAALIGIPVLPLMMDDPPRWLLACWRGVKVGVTYPVRRWRA